MCDPYCQEVCDCSLKQCLMRLIFQILKQPPSAVRTGWYATLVWFTQCISNSNSFWSWMAQTGVKEVYAPSPWIIWYFAMYQNEYKLKARNALLTVCRGWFCDHLTSGYQIVHCSLNNTRKITDFSVACQHGRTLLYDGRVQAGLCVPIWCTQLVI